MILNNNYTKAKNITISFLKENNVDSIDCISFDMIDVFKLGTNLGFMILEGSFPNDDKMCVLLVNEKEKTIDKFNSNKVLVFRDDMPLNYTIRSVAYELANYIYSKHLYNDRPLVLGELYKTGTEYPDNMVSMIASTLVSPLTYHDTDININYETQMSRRKKFR